MSSWSWRAWDLELQEWTLRRSSIILWPTPKKKLSSDQQRNLLVKAKLLDLSSAETPKDVTKDNSGKRGRASSTATEHANCGNATEPAIAKAHDFAKFFLWDADFQNYNEARMTAHDPKAYKWSTGKKLFDYTPHVTKEDWLNALRQERYTERQRNAKQRERWAKDADMLHEIRCWTVYKKTNPLCTHLSSDEIAWVFNDGWEAPLLPAPYKPFLDNDWCRHCFWPRCQGWYGWRRPSTISERSKMAEVSYYWSCEPQELLWVGGTYARDPTCFPKYQQETEWIYVNLRPLRIQPPIELMRIHSAQPHILPSWPAPNRTVIQLLRRFQENSVEACGAQLYNYMKLHGMLSNPIHLWYGYELPVRWFKRSFSNPSWRQRTKEEREDGAYQQPPATALCHPMTPSVERHYRSAYTLLLPSAKRLEQMPRVEGAATEHAFEIQRRSEEGTKDDDSADDEDYYGTLT